MSAIEIPSPNLGPGWLRHTEYACYFARPLVLDWQIQTKGRSDCTASGEGTSPLRLAVGVSDALGEEGSVAKAGAQGISIALIIHSLDRTLQICCRSDLRIANRRNRP